MAPTIQAVAMLAAAAWLGHESDVAQIAARGAAIRTIDPLDRDFADLEPIGTAIGDARMVQLGVPSYGDGAAFQACCRLVAYLHETRGFDVLVFESGLFDCSVMERKLHEDVRVDEAVSYGVSWVYGASAECLPVFEYARATHGSEHPLELSGFDPQFTGRGAEDYRSFVRAWLEKDGHRVLDATQRGALDAAIRRLFTPPFMPTPAQLERDRGAIRAARDAILGMRTGADSRDDALDIEFVDRTLANLEAQSEMRLLARPNGEPERAEDLRERAMGENLVWLAKSRHAGRKIVVWSLSRHVARAIETAASDGADAATNANEEAPPARVHAGDIVHEALGAAVYTLCFTAHAGRSGLVLHESAELPPAPNGTFEALAHDVGQPWLFVDLRGAREDQDLVLGRPLRARALDYVERNLLWPRACDGFFFVDVMTPATAR